MNKKQRNFYERNVKRIIELRQKRNEALAIKIETINQLLKGGKIDQALQWAFEYEMPLDFILDIKQIFLDFSD
jgi:hypothetical protein